MQTPTFRLSVILFALFLYTTGALAQQAIAKIKIASNDASKKQVNPATVIVDSVTSLNNAIRAYQKDSSIRQWLNLHQKINDPVFENQGLIQNFAAQKEQINSLNARSLAYTKIDTVRWFYPKELEYFQSVNALIREYDTAQHPQTLLKLKTKLDQKNNIAHTGYRQKLSASVNKLLNQKSNPTADGTLSKDTIPTIDAMVINDTVSKASDTTHENGKCPKLASISDMKIDKQNDGLYLISLVDANGGPLKTFPVSDFNEKLFYDKLGTAIFSLCDSKPVDSADSASGKNLLARLTKENLYQRFLEVSLSVDNSQDLAGRLKITKHIWAYFPHSTAAEFNFGRLSNNALSRTGLLLYSYINEISKRKMQGIGSTPGKRTIITAKDSLPFTVYSIQIQFEDGFIENICVNGKLDGHSETLKFENAYPIAFSTKSEFKNMRNIWLFEKTNPGFNYFSINLAQLLYYGEEFAIDNKDFSPQNQVYKNENITDTLTVVNLFKEQTSQILEAKIFTDLKGVGVNNPNGLVQTELSKKLNLWSSRNSLFPRLFNNEVNWGVLNYLIPFGSLNKVESNNKYLVLDHFDTLASPNNPKNALTYTSTVSLYSHQLFKIGADLTVLTIDVPRFKSTFSAGIGAYFGGTSVQDTARFYDTVFHAQLTNNVIQRDINTFEYGPFMSWQIYPNPKYGLIFSWRVFSFKALTHDFMQVRDSANFVQFIQNRGAAPIGSYSYSGNLFKHCLSTVELFAFFKPTENNKIFFRYRLTRDYHNSAENFRQIQLGIATSLSYTRENKNGKANTKQQTGSN